MKWSCSCPQDRTMDAFGQGRIETIDGQYVDGVSVTSGSPRKHVWTFAIGISVDENRPSWNCPCAEHPGPQPPSFVGNDYYCESGSYGWPGRWLTTHRLWDGHCSSKSKCCFQQPTPYFAKSLRVTTTDDLEVRLCANEGIGNENVGLERMVLYVRWYQKAFLFCFRVFFLTWPFWFARPSTV